MGCVFECSLSSKRLYKEMRLSFKGCSGMCLTNDDIRTSTFGDIPNSDDTADSGRLRKVRTPDIFQKLLSIEAKDVTQSRGPEPSAVVLASVFRDITIGPLSEIK